MKGRVAGGCCVVLVATLACATTVSAKILKTRSSSGSQALDLTVGSGAEYEDDGETAELGLPFLVDWGMTRTLKLTVEPQYTFINSTIDGESTNGLGDLETSITWDFVTERRYRPLFSAVALIKWPTAATDIGTGEPDYSLGAIIGKEFSTWDLEFNCAYTWVGSPPDEQLENSTEFSVATEWQMTPRLSLEAEIATASGGVRGQAGTIGGVGTGTGGDGGRETEATIGLAELLTHRFKLEEGVVVKADGGWQIVVAWEFDFGEAK